MLAALLLGAAATARFIQLSLESLSNMNDLRNSFVPAAARAWAGVSPYGPLKAGRSGEFVAGSTAGAVHTPPFLVLMWPWTVLPGAPGRVIWLALETLALLGVLVVVYRGLGRPSVAEGVTAAAILVLLPPIHDSLNEGQIGVYIGLLLAIAMLAHRRGRPLAGGVALGLTIAMKLSPILVVPYFLWRRNWRLVAWGLLTAALAAALTLPLGWGGYWAGFIRDNQAVGSGTANVLNQSLNGVLLRLVRPDLSGLPIDSPGTGFQVAWLLGLGLLAVALIWGVRRIRLPEDERAWTEFGVIILVLPLFQPFAWPHHFAQAALVVPVAVRLVARRHLGRVTAVLLGLITAIYVFAEYPGFRYAGDVGSAAMKGAPLAQLAASVTFLFVLAVSAILIASRWQTTRVH
jgi:alpha-1,2-mannosyltransferase